MKRLAAFALAALVVAPALAQPASIETEAKPLMDQWIAGFNRSDAAGLAKNVYTSADEAALAKMLRSCVTTVSASLISMRRSSVRAMRRMARRC